MLTAACTLFCATPVLADSYYLAGGSQNGTAFVIDTDTIKDLSPGKKSVQIIVNQTGPSYTGDTKYTISTTYVDCAKPALAEPLRVFYNASGAVIRQLDHTADVPYYRPVAAGTLAEAQVKAVCATDTAPIQAKSMRFDDVAGLIKSLDDYYAAQKNGSAH